MLVIVNKTDISEHINETSYKMDVEDVNTSWVNGNNVTIVKKVRERITGSFEIALYGKNGMDTASFLELWNGAVKPNGTIDLLVYVPALGRSKAIDAIYRFKSTKHVKLMNGNYMDVFEITIEER